MSMKFTDLQCKEVICVSNGQRLGFVADVMVEIPEGNICAIVVPCSCRFPGGLVRRDDSDPVEVHQAHWPGYRSGGRQAGSMPGSPQKAGASLLKGEALAFCVPTGIFLKLFGNNTCNSSSCRI